MSTLYLFKPVRHLLTLLNKTYIMKASNNNTAQVHKFKQVLKASAKILHGLFIMSYNTGI